MVSRKQLAYLALSVALVGLAMVERASGGVSVTVDANTALGRLPATAFGINAAVWDGHLLDANLPGLLQQAGVKIMRYPGGSTADVYHWQTNSTEPGQSDANPNNTFDAFMGIVQQTGAQAMITRHVNFLGRFEFHKQYMAINVDEIITALQEEPRWQQPDGMDMSLQQTAYFTFPVR